MEVAPVDVTGLLRGLPSTNIDVLLLMNDFDPATSLRTVIFHTLYQWAQLTLSSKFIKVYFLCCLQCSLML